MSKLPRHIVLKNGVNLVYFRKIPKRIVEQTNCKPIYQESLGLKLGASEAQIERQRLKCLDSYDVYIKMLTNSVPDAFSESEFDIAATALLKKIGRRPAEFAFFKPRPHAIEGLTWTKSDEASVALTGTFDGVEYQLQGEEYYGGLTSEQEVLKRAWFKLKDTASVAPKTLSSAFHSYITEKGLTKKRLGKKELRDNARILRRVKKLESLIGDAYINEKTGRMIREALKYYAKERKGVVKQASINREINDMMAFVNWAEGEYGYEWNVKRPALDIEKSKPKKVFSWEQQKYFVQQALKDSLPDRQKVPACLALLMLQGGLMQSEIGRLELDSIKLEGKYPYVIIKGKVKTVERVRLVPIVLGLDFIKENITQAKKYLSTVTESMASKKVATFFREYLEIDRTAHCLRHSLAHNFRSNGVPLADGVAIGGWSGSNKDIEISEHGLEYGADGLEYEESLAALYKLSLKVHKHLLSVTGDNVVRLHG